MDENEKKRIRLSLRVKKDPKISTNTANVVSVNNFLVLQPKCSSTSTGTSFVLDQKSASGVTSNLAKPSIQSWTNWPSLPDLTQKADKTTTAVHSDTKFICTQSTTTEWTPLPQPCRKCFLRKRQSAHGDTAKFSSVVEKVVQNVDDSRFLQPVEMPRAGMSGQLDASTTAEQTHAQLELHFANKNCVSPVCESSRFSPSRHGQFGQMLDKPISGCHSAVVSIRDPLSMESSTDSAAKAVAEPARLAESSKSVHVVTGPGHNSAAMQTTKAHVLSTCQPTASVSQIPPKAKLKPLFRNTLFRNSSIDTMLKSTVNTTANNNNIVQTSENLKCVRGQTQLERCPLCNILFDTRTSQAERTAHISACIVVDDDAAW